MQNQLKRLIEVDLPIRRISSHARSDKGRKDGHISSLHMWWARRPLAACRAVLCAALVPDPADEHCPEWFVEYCAKSIAPWIEQNLNLLSRETLELTRGVQPSEYLDDRILLRDALLSLIVDFCDFDAGRDPRILSFIREIVSEAHVALGNERGSTPVVVDPFAGGGAIPLEAARLGASSIASDLNPLPVLLNQSTLHDIPQYGDRLAQEFKKASDSLLRDAKRSLREFYPASDSTREVVAYLWARTLTCAGPGCGAVIPLLTDLAIAKRKGVYVSLEVSGATIRTYVRKGKPGSGGKGTVRTGSITCPRCAFTMKPETYRSRARNGELGAILYAVVERSNDAKFYRDPTEEDQRAFENAAMLLTKRIDQYGEATLVPTEYLSEAEPRRLNVLQYGFRQWKDLFNARQLLALSTLNGLVKDYAASEDLSGELDLKRAVTTLLALAVSNLAQYNSSVSTYLSDGLISVFIQSSSIPMRANYAEASPIMSKLVGGLEYQFARMQAVVDNLAISNIPSGNVYQRSADAQILPNNSVSVLACDPPYYFAIPYAELSDFYYVWLKRSLFDLYPALLTESATPKKDEAIQNLPHSGAKAIQKTREHFQEKITASLKVARQELVENGIGIVVFAHASTDGWEALLRSLLDADWVITASWPIDTEKAGRMLANRQRALSSSIHLVCRPRQHTAEYVVGEWREITGALPKRIHAWMPRLAKEGIVGADAIFACLGPALELFSRYERVEKANGDVVALSEFLELIWSTVSREALELIFKGADSGALEPDARLTAVWLWTVAAGATTSGASLDEADSGEQGDEDYDELESVDSDATSIKVSSKGFGLPFDAARKLAQGLGVDLDGMTDLVEVKGDKARLLSVSERAVGLFGKSSLEQRPKAKSKQLGLFGIEELMVDVDLPDGPGEPGSTALNKLHQAMILFGSGRSDALRRFIVEMRVGYSPEFWALGQAMSALYPDGTEEKRWVDGVLGRKKGLGF